MFVYTLRTVWRVQSLRSAAVLGVVVHEHVVGDGKKWSFHADLRRDHDLQQ